MPNPNCKLEVSHSKRPMQNIELTWSRLCFGYLGGSHPEIPRLLRELYLYGASKVTDASGTLHIKRIGVL